MNKKKNKQTASSSLFFLKLVLTKRAKCDIISIYGGKKNGRNEEI